MMPDGPVIDAALRAPLHGIRGLLLDLDGVLVLAERPIDGAAEALSSLDAAGVPYLIVTNTSLVSRATLSRIGARMGLHTPPERLQSALSATAAYCATRFAGRGLYVLATDDALTEFAGQRLVNAADADAGAEVAAVVLGDAVDQLTREALDRAFRLVRGGAELVGMHRNKWWLTPAGVTLDAGAYLAGLEYATDTRATVVGKPSRAFFQLAADRLLAELASRDGGRRPGRGSLAMVGDDVWSDIDGARRAGLRTIFVHTGKHGAAELDAAAAGPRGFRPDVVASSLLAVVRALAQASLRRRRHGSRGCGSV
jgi:HAD superfamily hydrolase (TIGR01450 family)